ncbi:dethiobiotin synthase [Ancylothrix sp. C2]|uniref:dethiobiotin synthase n=1 Tax=Ancylothrix sp. D3o TaxID=2953691 RepID=UPI0021BB88DA|nr:dethiobiotin synthase [Ancylothrix sp. D3o]MCT7949938.1 dethiobiotin synthase [Ancylothrix sp. D3o]
MSKTLFITGTDTNAGKTILTSALAAYWQKYHPNQNLGIMKPLQSGEGDREFYLKLFELPQTAEELNPLYFAAPLAPPLAADLENRRVELEKVWPVLVGLQKRCDLLLVEALGGLGSPVTHELTVADIGRDWGLEALLVVPVRLGAISQAVTSVALARQTGMRLRGIVLNCSEPRTQEEIDQWTPAYMIEQFTGVPVLGCLPFLADVTNKENLIDVASKLDLERMIFW